MPLQLEEVEVSPHNPLDLHLAASEALSKMGVVLSDATVTVDISCFTKIQLLFFLRLLWERMKVGSLRLVYTLPSYYASLSGARLSVGRSILMKMPFVRTAGIGRCGKARNAMIIVLGHEGDRILGAWEECEPRETVLLQPEPRYFPELASMTRRQNDLLFEHCEMHDPGFTLKTCGATSIDEAIETCEEIRAELADDAHRPPNTNKQSWWVVPLGPKPIVAAMALYAAQHRVDMDLVYPVPRAYDPGYSVGIGHTFEWRLPGR